MANIRNLLNKLPNRVSFSSRKSKKKKEEMPIQAIRVYPGLRRPGELVQYLLDERKWHTNSLLTIDIECDQFRDNCFYNITFSKNSNPDRKLFWRNKMCQDRKLTIILNKTKEEEFQTRNRTVPYRLIVTNDDANSNEIFEGLFFRYKTRQAFESVNRGVNVSFNDDTESTTPRSSSNVNGSESNRSSRSQNSVNRSSSQTLERSDSDDNLTLDEIFSRLFRQNLDRELGPRRNRQTDRHRRHHSQADPRLSDRQRIGESRRGDGHNIILIRNPVDPNFNRFIVFINQLQNDFLGDEENEENNSDVPIAVDSRSNGESKGLSKQELELLPDFELKKKLIHDPSADADSNLCTICYEEFDVGQQLIALTCLHKFHVNCIKQWLKGNRKCPLCKKDAIYGT